MLLILYIYILLNIIYSITSVSNIPSHQKIKEIFKEMSWPLRLKLLNPTANSPSRRVGIESLVIRRQEEVIEHASPANKAEEDTDMRIKLFRLMYETVRDSDMKVKRAELIQSHYSNSSVFEIGYLMGDVQDRFNVMTDLAKTLERLYHDWKPIEHINAYEQVANHAIEVNHIVDLMQSISKKESEKDHQLNGLI